MNRRQFLGSIFAIVTTPIVTRFDWLSFEEEEEAFIGNLPGPISSSGTILRVPGFIKLIDQFVANDTKHVAHWQLARGSDILLRTSLAPGGMYRYVARIGEELILPKTALKSPIIPGVFTTTVYEDLDTREMMIMNAFREPMPLRKMMDEEENL